MGIKRIRDVVKKENVRCMADDSVTDSVVYRGLDAVLMTKEYLHCEYDSDLSMPLDIYFFRNSRNMGMFIEKMYQGLPPDMYNYPALAINGHTIDGSPVHCLLRNIDLDNNGDDRTFVLAHEIVHFWQMELTKGDIYANKWLAEGVADIIASNVVGKEATFRSNWHNILNNFGKSIPLYELHNKDQFEAHVKKCTMYPVYRCADLAALTLKDRFGGVSFRRYFQDLGNTKDDHISFQNVFKIQVTEYERGFNLLEFF